MKHLLIAAALFAASPAIASDSQTKQHQKELAQLQPKLSACIAAISVAQRHDNVWQDDNLSLQDCKDAGETRTTRTSKATNELGWQPAASQRCGVSRCNTRIIKGTTRRSRRIVEAALYGSLFQGKVDGARRDLWSGRSAERCSCHYKAWLADGPV
jgi:hypothetical protein